MINKSEVKLLQQALETLEAGFGELPDFTPDFDEAAVAEVINTVAERMRDGACAVWLRSAKVVRPVTTVRGSAAVCSKDCIPKRESVWAREHQLTCFSTDVEVRWPPPTLWNSTRSSAGHRAL